MGKKKIKYIAPQNLVKMKQPSKTKKKYSIDWTYGSVQSDYHSTDIQSLIKS